MSIKKAARAQILLETAIIFVSLATLAVFSLRLYSNLNLNMTSRLDKYRESRKAAVNNAAVVNPVDFLDYSPYHNIDIPGGGSGDWNFSEIFYQDPRMVKVERLLNRTDDILNVILPYKINQIYGLLEGENNTYDVILRKVSREDVQKAIALCQEMQALRQEAYDNYYEDMDEAGFDGIDHDGDGFYGAVSLLQQVLYQPIIPGPFDYTEEHQANRSQIQGMLDNLMSPDAQTALSTLLNDLLKPRLESAVAYLELALMKWNCYYIGNPANPECYCPEKGEKGGGAGAKTYCRVDYIIEAKAYIQEMVDFLGAMETVPPLAEQQIASQIYDMQALLAEPYLKSNVLSSVDDCEQMLSILEAQEDTGSDYSALKDLVNEIKDDLNSSIDNWDEETVRDAYLENAKQNLATLEEIVNA